MTSPNRSLTTWWKAPRSTTARTAETTGVYESSRDDLKNLAKNYIWDNQLHGQAVPDSLMRDGSPIPLDEMTEEQRQILNDEWMSTHHNFSEMVRKVTNAYDAGAVQAQQSQSGNDY